MLIIQMLEEREREREKERKSECMNEGMNENDERGSERANTEDGRNKMATFHSLDTAKRTHIREEYWTKSIDVSQKKTY